MSHISKSYDIAVWQNREEHTLWNTVQMWSDKYFGSRTHVCKLQGECGFECSVFCTVLQLRLRHSVLASIVRIDFYKQCLAGLDLKSLFQRRHWVMLSFTNHISQASIFLSNKYFSPSSIQFPVWVKAFLPMFANAPYQKFTMKCSV